MIGNAVPVNLAKFVAEGIFEYIHKGNSRQQYKLFDTEYFDLPNTVLRRLR